MADEPGPRGKFIVIEGGDGVGKSTQVGAVVKELETRGVAAIATREPGGTSLGEELRAILASDRAISPSAEALLISAARAQHCAEVIKPALAQGRWVVSDRFTGSFYAYQGYGRGIPLGELEAMTRFATSSLVVDLEVLLVPRDGVSPYRALDGEDRFESMGDTYHQRVASGFAELADRLGWAVVEGSGTVSEVTARIMSEIEARFLGDTGSGEKR